MVFSPSENFRGESNNIFDEVKKELDDFSYSRILFYNRRRNEGLIKCNHHQVGEIRKNLEEKDFKILGISGTIKAATRKFMSD